MSTDVAPLKDMRVIGCGEVNAERVDAVRRCAHSLVGLALCTAIFATDAAAQKPAPSDAGVYPNRPIRMVIAFPPGGSNDLIARFIGSRLTAKFGQQIVYDYRGGASGVIGTEIVARAVPDGYTLLFASTSHTMNEVIRKVPYDTLGSFAPVAMFGRGPNMLVANPAFPAKTLPELIALAKASPGKFQYASTGIAGMHHFGGELFKRTAGIDLGHVAYKGGGASSFAVLAGEVPLMFSTMPLGLPFVRTDKLRALGVGGATRSPLLPTVPTLAEGGAHGYEFTVWWGLVAPAQTPAAIIARLNTEINNILRDPEAAKQLATEGAEVTVWTPAQFGAMLKENMAKWRIVAREANIRAE
jgi:tripartite-type tricarboxylate transporter receptor subunit TctC